MRAEPSLNRTELLALVQQISRHTDRLLGVLLQLLEEASEEQNQSRQSAWREQQQIEHFV